MSQIRIPSTWLTTALVFVTIWIFSPFWPSLLLAVWIGLAGLQVMPRLTRFLRGHAGIAASLLMVAVILVAIPIVALLFSVATDAWAFVQRMTETPEIREILATFGTPADPTAAPATDLAAVEGSSVVDGSAAPSRMPGILPPELGDIAAGSSLPEGSASAEGSGLANVIRDDLLATQSGSGASPSDGSGAEGSGAEGSGHSPTNLRELMGSPLELLAQYSARAWDAVQFLAGAAIRATLDILVFMVVLYAVLTEGPRSWQWIVHNSPIPQHHLQRYAAAFVETGKGLVLGFGGAALAQATVATILFSAVGVSRALVLGLLTFLGATVPGVGTAFVWAPVAAGLALNGRTQAAVVVVLVGMFVIGTLDNILRPMLARYGSLNLPMHLVFVSMLGGLLLLGPAGLLLGVLTVRMASEALQIRRSEVEQAMANRGPTEPVDSTSENEPM
jgi:predicted PurR-regulated permease PerM